MDIPKARTIDDLYQKTKEYDLVLTTDAPLADALTNRLETPVVGTAATTPLRLVLQEYENTSLMRRQDLFLHLLEKTSLSPKRAVTVLDAITSAWQHTGRLRGILEYDRFDTPAIREAIEAIEGTDNIYGQQQAYSIDKDLDIAVIGFERFTALDRSILPDDYDTIDAFHDREIDLPPFNVFASTTGLISAIEDTVTRERADDIAIVMDPSSRYQALVESVLDANDIPYLLPDTYSEDRTLRLVLEMLETGLSRDHLTVGDVQPLLRTLGIHVPDRHDNKRLTDAGRAETDAFLELLDAMIEDSFAKTLSIVEDRLDRETGAIQEVLEDLGILDAPVTEERIDLLRYYLDTFQIKDETASRGVLIASPGSTAYIDKPTVLHIGMDSSWTDEIKNRPWIDRENEQADNIRRFQLLLQNGTEQRFLVQDRDQNRPMTPCSYFTELADGRFETFTDADHRRYSHKKDAEDGFHRKKIDVDRRHKDAWSKSSLETFAWSPRLYLFKKLVSDIDTFYTIRGNLFHDFAEFYVSQPDIIEEEGIETFLDIIMDEVRPYRDDRELHGLRSRFRVGLETITAFLDQCELQDSDTDAFEQDPDNAFAEHFDAEITATVTELEFHDSDLGAKGIVDLLAGPDRIIDFKTGTRTSPSSIVRRSNLAMLDADQKPSFQAMLYLTHQRRLEPDTELSFVFLHVFGDDAEKLNGDTDMDAFTTTDIRYRPRRFEAHLDREETFEELKHRTKALEKLLDPLGYDGYRQILETIKNDDIYENEQFTDQNREEIQEQCRQLLNVGRGKDITARQLEKGTDRLLSHIHTMRTQNYFEEDLDAFEIYIQERLTAFNQDCVPGRFPVGDADRTDRTFNHKDLVREPEADR